MLDSRERRSCGRLTTKTVPPRTPRIVAGVRPLAIVAPVAVALPRWQSSGPPSITALDCGPGEGVGNPTRFRSARAKNASRRLPLRNVGSMSGGMFSSTNGRAW